MLKDNVQITIELGPALTALSKNAGALTNLLSGLIQMWFERMGLALGVTANVVSVEKPKGARLIDVALLINGVQRGFSKRQIVRAYESATKKPSGDLETGVTAARLLLSEVDDTGKPPTQALTFMAGLLMEAVKGAVDQLVTASVAEAVLTRAREVDVTARHAVNELDRELVTDVLRRLSRLHIAVPNSGDFVRAVFRGQSRKQTAAEIAEKLIDRWRPRDIEIYLPVELAETVLEGPFTPGTPCPPSALKKEAHDLLGLMCDGLFYEIGVLFADFSVVPDPTLTGNCCRFRLQGRTTPVLLGLNRDEFLVNGSPRMLEQSGIANAKPRLNPANTNPCAIITGPIPETLRNAYTFWNQFEYLVLLLSAELRLAADSLLSLNTVKGMLGQLNDSFPTLIAAVFQRYSSLEVAQVLRWLLKAGISIRDLRSVLELMLNFSYTTGVRSPTAGWSGREPYVYLGNADFTGEPYFTSADPFVPIFDMEGMQLFAEPDPEWITNGRLLAEFVKCGLRRSLNQKLNRGQDRVICYLLDASIETRLLGYLAEPRNGKLPFSEQETSEILQGIAAGIVETYNVPVLVLGTTPDVALLVQDLIEEDFPEVVVLHRQAVDESANLQPIARVPGNDPEPSSD